MAESERKIVVITDTNILINLSRIGQITLLAQLPGFRFGVTSEVLDEVIDQAQRTELDKMFDSNSLDRVQINDLSALELFAELRETMGRGEASCLAHATSSGCHLASDEKEVFRRKALELIGQKRLLRTEDLILTAIRCDLMTVEEADQHKATLAANRYAMGFASFGELID